MMVRKIKEALDILDKYGLDSEFYSYEGDIYIYPSSVNYSEEDISSLEFLGFFITDDARDGWTSLT